MSEPLQKRTKVHTLACTTLIRTTFVHAFMQLSREDADTIMRKLTKRHNGLAKVWLHLYPPYAKLIYRMFGPVPYAEWKRLKVKLRTIIKEWTHGWIHPAWYHNNDNFVHMFTGPVPAAGTIARSGGKYDWNATITGWMIEKFPECGDDRYPTIVPYDEFMLYVWDLNCTPYVDGHSLKDLLARDN
jgi:hypothetical protein